MSGPTAQTPANANAVIFDVTAADFETQVIAASMERPVIVDFWAPWCGPCKQMMPALEKVVNAAGGQVLLAKVNIDESPELAEALRVQSVPTVFGFFGGKPIEAFQGAQPESTIQAFVDKLIEAAKAGQPGAIDIPEALQAAAQALAGGDFQTAQSVYAQIIQQDEKNAPAYAGMLRVFVAAGAIEQAQGMVANLPAEITGDADFAAALTALEMAEKAAGIDLPKLEKAAAKKSKKQQPQIDLAEGQFALGHKEQAIDTLLASIETDQEWGEQAARKALLKFFEALGHSDPLTIQGRKKLSTLLFS